MHDVIIIGAGPAGMTAGIYAARKKLKTLIISKDVGGQMIWSSDVENYSGFTMITGADLTLKFREHIQSLKDNLEVIEGQEVVSLEKNITSFSVGTKSGQHYYSKTVIVATGRRPKRLGIPGEDKFFGKGVAVCATCDAPLYKNKDVAVIGGGNSALDAIVSLAKVARFVYAINANEKFHGEEILIDKVLSLPNVRFYYNSQAQEIVGETSVKSIKFLKDGKDDELEVSGVFTEIGYELATDFENLTQKNDHGEVIVDNNLQTSVEGLYCAGDANNAWGEQIIIAAGEGAKAAMALSDYLNRTK